MKIISLAFLDKHSIPIKYTCDGDNVNPPLEFLDVPKSTKSLALVVDDPDAPGDTFVHWLLWGIDSKVSKIEENSVPPGCIVGKNSADGLSYTGPCPPSGTHRYYFKLYALDNFPEALSGASKIELEESLNGHIIDSCEIIGLYPSAK